METRSGRRTEVCIRDQGFDDDLVVRTSSECLAAWHTGKVSLGGAMRAGTMTVDGRRSLVRSLASWGGRSAFAHVQAVRPRATPAGSPAGGRRR